MKNPLMTFGLAVLVVAAVIATVFYVQRGSHLQLQGTILKVRTAPLDENSSVAVVDFRFQNLADHDFEVSKVTVTMEDGSGAKIDGAAISEVDTGRLFQAIPLLGQKYNPSLIVRNSIPPHATEDRMIAARFEVAEEKLNKRRQLWLHIQPYSGEVSEIKEK